MINLKAMWRWIIGWVVWFFILPASVVAQADEGILILSPADQQVLQGVIEVQARVSFDDVQTYELLFGYSGDTDERNLFLLTQGNSIPDSQLRHRWDTTLIPDGDYRLVLRVYLINGERREAVVETVRVRNYSVVESPTASGLVLSTAPVVPTPPETPTPLPVTSTPPKPNPGSVQPVQWTTSVLRSVGITIVLFVILGGLIRLRRPKKRR
ncbi:hypothetical protein [Bellilinea caldifistulae]|nr:hypothetical protein [Bellilinea caldifistulae]